MNVKLLIDGIVRQTTVLIAQLATAAGVRAPMAHLADQVFCSLAKELEAQGVGKKVAADMFGMALRSYQRKTNRVAPSASSQGKTLFEAILEHVETHRGISRRTMLQRFARDGERETVGVLTDLVHSGLLYSTGSGNDMLYGVTTEAERQRLTRVAEESALANMAWGAVYRCPDITPAELCAQLGCAASELAPALEQLQSEGRVSTQGSDQAQTLRAATLQIPVGADAGWETAVFDHFQAVATAISNKITMRSSPADRDGLLGGTTLRFELHDAHPHRDEALGLLARLRDETAEVWHRVSDYNDAHPYDESQRFNLCVYFGQTLDDAERRATRPE